MRHLLLLATCLWLAACAGRREVAVERECTAAQVELRRGRLPEAEARIDGCERRFAGHLSEPQQWRLRLLKAEVLLARGQVPDALPPAALPAPLALRREVILATISTRRQTAEALGLLQQAEADARRLGDGGTGREIENLRFSVLLAKGEPAAAEACLARAVASARAARDDYWLACSLLNLSYLRTKREYRHDEAVRFGEEAIEAARRAGAERFLGAAYGNTSQALAQLGAFDKAVRYRREALELQRRVDDRRQVRESLGEMGNLFVLSERPADAAPWYQQAFEASVEGHAPLDAARSAGNLALALISLKKWDEAEAWNGRAARLKKEAGASASLLYQKLNAALIAAGRNAWGEAGRLFRELLAEAGDNPGLRFDAEMGLGNVCANTRRAEASRHFEAAVRIVESNRDAIAGEDYRITFLSRMIRAWRRYVDFLIAEGRIEAAFDMAERSRAQALAEKLRLREGAVWRRASVPALRQAAARYHCRFLSYWLGPERSALWVVDGSGLRMHVLPPAHEIDRMAAGWQRRIEEEASDPLESARQEGERLAAVLFPAVDLTGRLVIVPDGTLHGLNLETLPVPGRNRYLLDDATVVLAPSLAVFAATPPVRDNPPREALLVGVGRPGDPSYPPLPKAEAEVQSIAARYAESQRLVLVGNAATPARVRKLDLRRFGMIHFAAHAEANRESPLDSSIVLAREGEESKLYARELARLPLAAEVVTLSACRSAGARAYAGEGLVGLTWAVLSSGAHTVIASLWPVSDRAVSLLMDNLYAALARGVPPAAALREAKLAMRRSSGSFRHPFYWAPLEIYVRGGF